MLRADEWLRFQKDGAPQYIEEWRFIVALPLNGLDFDKWAPLQNSKPLTQHFSMLKASEDLD